jgi:serine/threonine-protein kinase
VDLRALLGRGLPLPVEPPTLTALRDDLPDVDRLVIHGAQGVAVVGLLAAAASLLMIPGYAPTLGLVAPLLGVWVLFTALVARGGAMAVPLARIELVIESALPWLFLILFARAEGPEYAIGSWVPPLVYACVIIGSILRLRPLLPIVIGALSAIQYFIVYWHFVLPYLPPEPAQGHLYSPKMQVVRAFVIYLAGLLASFMTMALRKLVGRHAKPTRPPDVFGKYRLEVPIASGGMATVYAATFCAEGGFERPVAVKRIHPHLALQESFVDAFRNEAELGARLVHPNIVQVLDFGHIDSSYFLAMEFVDGVTLGALMRVLRKQRVVVSPRVIAFVGREILAGLHYSHAGARDAKGNLLRVVHRDLSPANVLVSREGQVKISDFGIARALKGANAYVTQSFAGHVHHMAPEQAAGNGTDERSDLFAAGVILWELACGTPLFRRNSEAATLFAIMNDPIPAPSGLRPELAHAPWDAFFSRALARNPSRRFQTAREMADQLEAILGMVGPPRSDELPHLVARTATALRRRRQREEAATVAEVSPSMIDSSEVQLGPG